MKAVAAIAVILLCACGSTRTLASASPSGLTSGSPAIGTPASAPRLESQSPTPSAQSPSAVPLLPVTDPGFSCRLPVDASLGESPLRRGLVTVPLGTLEVDSNAQFANVTRQPWSDQTTAQPVLKGSEGLGYDLPLPRWVPAYPEVFSPVGSEYAWTDRDTTSNRLHVAKAADGRDRSWSVKNAQQGGAIPR